MIFDKIKKISKYKGLTLKEVLKRSEISEPTYYNCAKRGSIETKYLEKIAQTLNVPISSFFEKNGSSKNTQIGINSNQQIGGSQTLGEDCSKYIREIELLKQQIKDKVEIINLLKSK